MRRRRRLLYHYKEFFSNQIFSVLCTIAAFPCPRRRRFPLFEKVKPFLLVAFPSSQATVPLESRCCNRFEGCRAARSLGRVRGPPGCSFPLSLARFFCPLAPPCSRLPWDPYFAMSLSTSSGASRPPSHPLASSLPPHISRSPSGPRPPPHRTPRRLAPLRPNDGG